MGAGGEFAPHQLKLLAMPGPEVSLRARLDEAGEVEGVRSLEALRTRDRHVADEARLGRLLRELLDRAIDRMVEREQSIVVVVNARPHDAGGLCVRKAPEAPAVEVEATEAPHVRGERTLETGRTSLVDRADEPERHMHGLGTRPRGRFRRHDPAKFFLHDAERGPDGGRDGDGDEQPHGLGSRRRGQGGGGGRGAGAFDGHDGAYGTALACGCPSRGYLSGPRVRSASMSDALPTPAHAPASTAAGSGHEPAPGGRAARLALLFGPIASVGFAWWFVGALASFTIANEALAAGGVFLTFVGPSVIFGPAVLGPNSFTHLTTESLVAVTVFFTCVTAFFYAYNFDLLERLPRLGPWVHRTRASMQATLDEKPWIRRFALFGVGFFVLLPLPGSGTLGGSIVGRLVGLSRWGSFIAVAIGGSLVCFVYGWFGESLVRFGDAHRLTTVEKVGAAAVFLVVLAVIGKWIGRRRRASTAGR